jgi:hypothetical protein
MFHKRIINSTLLLILVVTLGFQNNILIPVTYFLDDIGHVQQFRRTQAFSEFIDALSVDGRASLKGIYVADKLQLPITYQPSGNPGFVTTAPDSVTLFSTASNYGSIGLIAHNHLAGREFFEVEMNDEIYLIYGNGDVQKYVVSEIREYQALSPTSPYSSFINLADTGRTITYRDLFFDTYGIGNRLVLQTCISRNNFDSWGRLFIIATPVN